MPVWINYRMVVEKYLQGFKDLGGSFSQKTNFVQKLILLTN
jgi:hypothetical protein